jgi:hypothetical protein
MGVVFILVLSQHFTVCRAADIPSLSGQQFRQQVLRADLCDPNAGH